MWIQQSKLKFGTYRKTLQGSSKISFWILDYVSKAYVGQLPTWRQILICRKHGNLPEVTKTMVCCNEWNPPTKKKENIYNWILVSRKRATVEKLSRNRRIQTVAQHALFIIANKPSRSGSSINTRIFNGSLIYYSPDCIQLFPSDTPQVSV